MKARPWGRPQLFIEHARDIACVNVFVTDESTSPAGFRDGRIQSNAPNSRLRKYSQKSRALERAAPGMGSGREQSGCDRLTRPSFPLPLRTGELIRRSSDFKSESVSLRRRLPPQCASCIDRPRGYVNATTIGTQGSAPADGFDGNMITRGRADSSRPRELARSVATPRREWYLWKELTFDAGSEI